MRTIGYFRYDPAAPSDSPKSRSYQERDFHNFCQRHDHTLVTLFADPHREPEQTWDALHDMMRHIRQEEASFVVAVTDPAHLGSTLEEAVDAVLIIDRLGSQVICTDIQMPDPLQGLLKAFLSSVVGATRRNRIREAMQAKALVGAGLGKPPYGYRIGRGGGLEEVPDEAGLVRLMFRLYLEEGIGVRRIAGHLNQRGYHTRRDQAWSMVTVRAILRNLAYMGTYARFGLRIPSSHPRIVSPQEFRQVQDIMQSRSPRRRQPDVQPFLLSGLVYCGECGNRMIGVTRRQSWRRRDGQRMRGVYRYYQCQSRTNQSLCDYHTWRAADLEEAVARRVRQELPEAGTTALSPENHGAAPANHQGTAIMEGGGSAAPALRRRYLRYLRKAADGTTSLATLRYLLDRLAEERRAREAGAVSQEGGQGIHATSPISAEQSPSDWERLDSEARRAVLKSLVGRVEVRGGEIAVRFKVGAE